MTPARLRSALPWPIVLLLCATIGLAPYAPQPHFFEKIGMLAGGTLTAPLDIFDLCMHGSPWLLLVIRLGLQFVPEPPEDQ